MEHLPVLLKEAIYHLQPEAGDIILDATVGEGGHAEKILKKIVPGGRLIAVDRDAEAIERAKERLKNFGDSVRYINDNFMNMEKIFDSAGVESVDGALFDLGIASFHVDEAERGFSFLKDGPLDMRFDATQKTSAMDVVNRYSQGELEELIKKYGEERHAKLVAKEICLARKRSPINTTDELKSVITKAVGHKYRRQRLHPAARTFQAIRISVNDELAAIEEGISRVIDHLKPGARISVISFHSLEDRIVKNIFRDKRKTGEMELVTKKPITPGPDEIHSNPRSRSAKLRVAERKR